jgi:hypothetical protein
MSLLRQRMIRELQLQRKSVKPVEAYVLRCVHSCFSRPRYSIHNRLPRRVLFRRESTCETIPLTTRFPP